MVTKTQVPEDSLSAENLNNLQAHVKNPNYNPNDPQSNRYIPNGQTITVPSATPDATQSINTAPEGIKAVFGDTWQPAEIFKSRGLLNKGIQGAVRIKDTSDVYTIGQGGEYVPDENAFEKLFGTRDQSNIVGEITPEQAKLLGINPENTEKLKATNAKNEDIANITRLAQAAGMSVEETQKILDAKYPVDTQSVYNELGIPDVVGKAFKQPDITTQQVYEKAYRDSSLGDVKNKMQTILDTINQRKKDLVTATNALNNNPWLSQASRTGRMRILNETANADINNLISEYNSLGDVYDKGVTEAENVAIRFSSDNSSSQRLYADQLNYLLNEAERKAGTVTAKNTAYNLRNIPDYLKAQADNLQGKGNLTLDQKVTLKEKGLTVDANGNVTSLQKNMSDLTPEQQKSLIDSGFTLVNGKVVSSNSVITDSSGNTLTTYTDGSGNINNITGWAANDQSKKNSMQDVANQIGKLTDENLDVTVKKFAPGITGDMIKKASAISGVSWEAILTQVVQEGTMKSDVFKKNNNFGGLTWNNQDWIKQFGGTKGSARPSKEGGNYIKFPTVQDGLNAMAYLQKIYNGRITGTATGSSSNDAALNFYVDMVKKDPTKISSVPASYKDKVATAITRSGEVTKTTAADDLKQRALQTAQSLLTKLYNSDWNWNPVGKSSIMGLAKIPGTASADFAADFNSLKSQLSLDAVSLLKGQGAVSDAERDLLNKAVSKLSLNQSDQEFHDTLKGIITTLSASNPDPLSLDVANSGSGNSDPAGIGI
ncbi:MAG: hypothetical protein PHQ46_10720 [Negativicutes bacterium]|nr:hypothetical protein [Negativicutes bacterium]